jgi:hypothetical protein
MHLDEASCFQLFNVVNGQRHYQLVVTRHIICLARSQGLHNPHLGFVSMVLSIVSGGYTFNKRLKVIVIAGLEIVACVEGDDLKHKDRKVSIRH